MESDIELLSRYNKTRDPIAFTELTRRYRGLVFAAARRVTHSHHDAEDITQACFLDLAQRADTIRESVPAWLHQQATYRAIDVLRRSAVRHRREQEGTEPAVVSEVPEWDQIGPLVDEAVNHLDDDLRIPVILYYLQEFTQDEIAAMLKLSRQTVARRLRLGIVALRDQIGKNGLFLSAGILGILLKEHAVEATPRSVHISLAKIGMIGYGPKAAPKSTVAQKLLAASQIKLVAVFSVISAIPLLYKALAILLLLSLAGWKWIDSRKELQQVSPYSALKAGFVPYVDIHTPFGFPSRVRLMTEDLHGFWSGGRELFFGWLYAQHPEWFADSANMIRCHGAVDFTNVGIYLQDLKTRDFGAGLIDFDDAALMPYQAELLQAMVSIEIAYAQLHDQKPQALTDAKRRMYASYQQALRATEKQTQQLLDDPMMVALSARAKRRWYDDLLRQYVNEDGHFRTVIRNGRHVRELLEPADDLRPALAAALSQAMANNPVFAKEFRITTVHDILHSMRDAAARTQLTAGGSHGIPKYLVLLNRPLRHADHDVILSLKQQIPSPPERADIDIESDNPPGRRVAASAVELSQGRMAAQISWCEINGISCTVQIREPWTQSLGPDRIFRVDQLLHASEILGFAAGASHAMTQESSMIAAGMTPELCEELQRLSAVYALRMSRQYQALLADPAARHDVLAIGKAETTWVHSGETR